MARLQGISGGLSGKTGSFTYRQSGGQTIVSQYQPVVKNPNSAGQQSQRAKFKLMSQLAAIMSPGFGTMSVTKRAGRGTPSQRNAFVQLNIELATTSDTAQGVVASIPMEQLKLTSSFRPLGSLSVTSAGGQVDASVLPSDASITKVRFVLVTYPTIAGVKQAQLSEIVDANVDGGTADHSFDATVGAKATVLAFGLIPTESAAGKINLDNIHTPSNDEFISAVVLNQLVADGSLVETATMGANVTVI